jgi:hypothetical protein
MRGGQLGAWLRLVLVLFVAQLGYYNRRDLFSHWIRKDQAARRPCTHACCRGMRAHPDKYPVVKRNAYLRSASDRDVADFYNRHGADTPRDEAARDQAIAEMQRRDMAKERREAAEERKRARWSARRADRAAVIENETVNAEAATRGVMLNRRGREAGIDPRTLFTGPEARARKYASEELLNYWEYNPRPTEKFFQGEDTRIGYGRMLAPRRRMTTEEAEWRDRYDRIKWAIETEVAA